MTFTGDGKMGAVLIVVPTFERNENDHLVSDYEADAATLANFLESVFCTATLTALKKMI
jgi:hypothetical protein